jgi:hypothetical protein
MKISRNFNRFYHSVIKEFYDKAPLKLKTDLGVLYMKQITYNGFKQILKYINLDYPRDEKSYPLSTRDIGNEKLLQHIEFLIKLAGENGIEFIFVEQEWNLLLRRSYD